MDMQIISLIAALSKDRVIGYCGKIPWNLPDDLEYFKRITIGHPIIMGRKTHESIGRVLPKRKNIVISSQEKYVSLEGSFLARTFPDALMLAGGQEVFVIGGERVYAEALPLAIHLYLTKVRGNFPGDAFFPEFDRGEWKEVSYEASSFAERVILERIR